MFTIAVTTADRDGALPTWSFNAFAHYQIRENQQIDQQKRHHDADAGNPSSCGMFLYKRASVFIDRLSPLTLSPVNKLNVGWIPIPRIDVFSSLPTALPLIGRTTALWT